MTRYHLVSQKNLPLSRVDGRTRESLPIDIPAPRPCSLCLSVLHSTNRSSLNGVRRYSPLRCLLLCEILYIFFREFVNPDLKTISALAPPNRGSWHYRGTKQCLRGYRCSVLRGTNVHSGTPLRLRRLQRQRHLSPRGEARENHPSFLVSSSATHTAEMPPASFPRIIAGKISGENPAAKPR